MRSLIEQEIELLKLIIPEAARVLSNPDGPTWLPEHVARGPRALARSVGSGLLRPFADALATIVLKQLGIES